MNRIAAVFVCLLLAGCSTAPEPKKEAEVKAPAASKVGAPEVFKVKLETSKGPVTIEVHREWAPRGADRFFELVKDGFYNDARFFRVLPNFVAQFGLAAKPAMTKKWEASIDDDAVGHTNSVGTVTFAKSGKNSRNTQVFVNLRSNQSLDAQGFAPFGRVVEGMEAVQKLYSKYGDAPDQEALTNQGNAYLKARYPLLDYIRTAAIL